MGNIFALFSVRLRKNRFLLPFLFVAPILYACVEHSANSATIISLSGLSQPLSTAKTGIANKNIPEIRLVEPEGTYFAWLDCSGLGLSAQQLNDLIINKAKLWLDAGDIFGKVAEQFQRVVLACPRSVIVQAMDSLKNALK